MTSLDNLSSDARSNKMNKTQLDKGKELHDQIENLTKVIESINEEKSKPIGTNKVFDIKINNMCIFSGTSPLCYNTGFKSKEEIFNLFIDAMVKILETKRDKICEEFDKL